MTAGPNKLNTALSFPFSDAAAVKSRLLGLGRVNDVFTRRRRHIWPLRRHYSSAMVAWL